MQADDSSEMQADSGKETRKGKGSGKALAKSGTACSIASITSQENIEEAVTAEEDSHSRCKGKGKCWATLHLLSPEDKKSRVQWRLQNVIEKAVRHAGTDAVSDAFVECLREAFDRERRLSESDTDQSGTESKLQLKVNEAGVEASDSVAVLFREVQRKAKLGSWIPGSLS